jgi:large subunit ribosomal protein L18
MAVSLRRLGRKEARTRRHRRIRKRVNGTAERPRLCVVRSLKHIYAQVIDDEKGVVLFGCSTLSPAIRETVSGIKPIEAGKEVGKLVAKMATERGITAVSFDRGGYIYCGRVKAVADGAREGKLAF